MINRRAFVAASSGLLMTSGLTLPRRAFAADYGHIGKEPPLSDFTRDSTSEEVTAGLDLTGKTVVITGANSGLGYETMRVLAMRGAHVIGTGRTAEKAETAAASVEGNVTPVVLELTDFDSIAACARDIEALGAPVDVLICNAGIMALPERELVRGIERQFAVNHLGHFVFSNLLLDSVKAAPQGRFVIVSSDGYKSAPRTAYSSMICPGRRAMSRGRPTVIRSSPINCSRRSWAAGCKVRPRRPIPSIPASSRQIWRAT